MKNIMVFEKTIVGYKGLGVAENYQQAERIAVCHLYESFNEYADALDTISMSCITPLEEEVGYAIECTYHFKDKDQRKVVYMLEYEVKE